MKIGELRNSVAIKTLGHQRVRNLYVLNLDVVARYSRCIPHIAQYCYGYKCCHIADALLGLGAVPKRLGERYEHKHHFY